MDSKEKKTPSDFWWARNPQHEDNADSGEDMFYDTAFLCMEEYAEQRAITFAEWNEKNGYGAPDHRPVLKKHPQPIKS